jgi:cytochrome o ubiquinol oxidase subunit 2
MGKDKNKLLGIAAILVTTLVASIWYGASHVLPVLDTKGSVGNDERHLIVLSTLLMLIVVVPVYFLTFFIAWKYRAENKSARYEPNTDGNRKLEFTWWAVPGIIILILSVVTWNSSHKLDPFRPISGDRPTMQVQVVALPWKWLFIYPAQNVASLNYLQIPVNTPVDFNITSDAPMNSFWIPALGGQIYAMAGMNTHLHLIANQAGDYRGVSANISGQGFAGMHFMARASSEEDFNKWLESSRSQNRTLDQQAYDGLAKPSQNDPVTLYSSATPGLYEKTILKYAVPSSALIGANVDTFTQDLHHHD